jgi:hypothetical protein
MEYLIGSLVALASVAIVSKIFKKVSSKDFIISFRYSQSYLHSLILPVMPFIDDDLENGIPTQSKNHYNKSNLKVLFSNNKAYWIKDNIFYNADVQNGIVLQETTSKVDIMGMDKVQLNKMSFIVEKLTGGAGNDSWNPGDKGL